MKNIIKLVIFFAFLMCFQTYAQDFVMPTDEEIMAVIEKYNFSKSQKEHLLKETRKAIKESITNGEINKAAPISNEQESQNTSDETEQENSLSDK